MPSGPKYATVSCSSKNKQAEIISLNICLTLSSGITPSLSLTTLRKISTSRSGLYNDEFEVTKLFNSPTF